MQRADVEVYLSLKNISSFRPSIIQFEACESRAMMHLIRMFTACDSAEAAALSENTRRVHAGFIPSSLLILSSVCLYGVLYRIRNRAGTGDF